MVRDITKIVVENSAIVIAEKYERRLMIPMESCFDSRAVAQAVSHWLPTAAVRVRVRAACGVCGAQSDTGAGFLRVLLFPLPIIIPPVYPSS
jgi:hypothetical protein